MGLLLQGHSEDDETDDRLRISATGDCGNDWDLRKMHRDLQIFLLQILISIHSSHQVQVSGMNTL